MGEEKRRSRALVTPVATPSEIGAKVAIAPTHQHNIPGAAASVRGPRPSSTAASVAEPAENAPCGRRRESLRERAQTQAVRKGAPVAFKGVAFLWVAHRSASSSRSAARCPALARFHRPNGAVASTAARMTVGESAAAVCTHHAASSGDRWSSTPARSTGVNT